LFSATLVATLSASLIESGLFSIEFPIQCTIKALNTDVGLTFARSATDGNTAGTASTA
jgi:hypothetical protein